MPNYTDQERYEYDRQEHPATNVDVQDQFGHIFVLWNTTETHEAITDRRREITKLIS